MLCVLKNFSLFICLSTIALCDEHSLPSKEDKASAFAQAESVAKILHSKAWKLLEKGNLLGSQKGCVKNPSGDLHQFPCSKSLKTEPFSERPLEKSTDSTKDSLLVFVSFSMPEASLKLLGTSAQSHNAILVMRGLHEDSFVKTAQKIEKLGIVVDINPELFDAHNVTSVPTFIKLQNGQALKSLKGNVTLEFALKKLEEKLTEKEEAGS